MLLKKQAFFFWQLHLSRAILAFIRRIFVTFKYTLSWLTAIEFLKLHRGTPGEECCSSFIRYQQILDYLKTIDNVSKKEKLGIFKFINAPIRKTSSFLMFHTSFRAESRVNSALTWNLMRFSITINSELEISF